MKFILGKKMSMTQMWFNDKVLAVTPIKAGPCVIAQVKTKDNDGYEALQFTLGERKEKNINKPQLGHFKKAGLKPAHVKEFRTEVASDFKIGDVVSVGTFAVGDIVNVCGTSKGRGFQGVVKRHGFHGFRKTHGNKDQERMPGSIGPKGPAHVFKGTKMGGRMGGDRVTTTNLEIVAIDEENDIIFIKGAVPGAVNGLLMIDSKGDMKVNLKKVEEVKEETPVVEEVKEETPVVEEVKEEVKEVKAEEAK
ncbi:50S ribosomal protein L3 [Patescibacteria group bacterium]|nr:50S ribosomal protein L3 [Patescibacteria group bacterium]